MLNADFCGKENFRPAPFFHHLIILLIDKNLKIGIGLESAFGMMAWILLYIELSFPFFTSKLPGLCPPTLRASGQSLF
jgi:hypothetical protein